MIHKADYQTLAQNNQIIATSDNPHYVSFVIEFCPRIRMSSNISACQNLGVREAARRNFLGLAGFFLGIILAIVLIGINASILVRLLVFIPFFLGYLGLLQAHHKTCVILGLRGEQNMDQGNEALGDSTLKAKLRSRSIKILISSALLAGLCTFITVAIHLERIALAL
jgi:hypothetical protein